MKMTNGIKIALMIVATLFVGFVTYGLQTDCPNTEGYFYCSASEQRALQH